MTRPNIVWIFPDEWRHDAFGYRGNRVVQTPNIDALAERGTVFTNAHCESPVCQPSRAGLLTQTYPAQHGLLDNDHRAEWHGTGIFPNPYQPNFLHSLQDAGYYTAVMGKTHFRTSTDDQLAAYGVDLPREEYDKFILWRYDTPYVRYLRELGLFGPWMDYVRSLLPWLPGAGGVEGNPAYDPERPRAAPDPVVPIEHQLDVFLGREASDFIRGYDREEPFFLWVAPIGPHSPWDAPSDAADRYDPADIPLGPQGRDGFPDNRWGEYQQWNHRHLRTGELSDDLVRLIGKYYYGLCSIIDRAVGEIVDALRESGRDADTWIFLSSDHGELLGDHGLISKRVFYKAAVLVPQLVVPPPGMYTSATIDSMTQAFDLVATMLDVAGVEPPQENGPARSLLPAVRGDMSARDAVFSEIAGFLMVATDQHKLIIHKDSGEPGALYDLETDPDERYDIVERDGSDAIPAILTRLADRYMSMYG